MSDLYQPSRDQFLALAADHAVVPVWREVLADLFTPLGVYDRLRRESGPTFLLESVEQGERWGRYSFIGLRPLLRLTAKGGQMHLEGVAPEGVQTAMESGDPLRAVDALLRALKAPELPGLPPLFAGLVGYLSYDVVRFIERLPDDTTDDLAMDDVRVMLPGQLMAFDHLRQRLLVLTNVLIGDDPGRQYDDALVQSEDLIARLGQTVPSAALPPPAAQDVTDATSNMSRDDFLQAVESAKEYIRAGDAFQIVPSQRLSLATTADPFMVYRVLRVINPSPYLYLFDDGDQQIVGSSPEALVTLQGRRATIWPIAGSKPRDEDPVRDLELEKQLLADEKERAEHVMLVDLARNDLGRVCELGSVAVDEFMGVVRYSHIMHIVSKVSGRVRDGMTAVDVVRATFPAGTLTGAPKVRAMEIIDELEPTRRGLYGGGIGYFDLAGNTDLCIAIRTLVFRDGMAHVQAGAGIVADSDPATEFQETLNKAMALLAAVRAAEEFQK